MGTYETSLPQVSFDKSNRHIREMIIEPLANTNGHSQTRKIKTSQCENFSVRRTHHCEMSCQSQCELPRLSVNVPSHHSYLEKL